MKKFVFIIVVIGLIILAAWLFTPSQPTEQPSTTPTLSPGSAASDKTDAIIGDIDAIDPTGNVEDSFKEIDDAINSL
jgi:hypothetical protein